MRSRYIKTLAGVIQLYTDSPSTWTQIWQARDKAGNRTEVLAPDAVAWTVDGAMRLIANRLRFDDEDCTHWTFTSALLAWINKDHQRLHIDKCIQIFNDRPSTRLQDVQERVQFYIDLLREP